MLGVDFSALGDLDVAEDRSRVAQEHYFMKRKFRNTGNGKNFLAGSLFWSVAGQQDPVSS